MPHKNSVDRDGMVKMLMDMVDIASPTGEEESLARYVVDRFKGLGLKTRLQQVGDKNYNAIAYWEGTGGGPTLMLNGHLDTSVTGRWEPYFTADQREPYSADGIGYENKARLIDNEWIFGNGVFNMKNAQAAFWGAIKALKESGVRLKGDVIVTATCGEIEKTPVDEYQGPPFRGYGEGPKFMVTRGVVADACIDGEPTRFKVWLGQAGTTWFKITTKGTFGHTFWIRSAGLRPAVEQMAKVIPAIQEWRQDYTERHEFMGDKPQVNIAAIRGGLPWRASRTALLCSLFVDVRMTPQQSSLDVKEELEAVLRRLKQSDPSLDYELEMYNSVPGCLVDREEPVVQAVVRAHQESFGQPPELVYGGAVYTDAIHFIAYGIPTINYGCGGTLRTGGYGWNPEEGEHQYIPDLVRGAEIFAMAIGDYCSQERAAVVPKKRRPIGMASSSP